MECTFAFFHRLPRKIPLFHLNFFLPIRWQITLFAVVPLSPTTIANRLQGERGEGEERIITTERHKLPFFLSLKILNNKTKMHLLKLQVYGLTTNQREREEIDTDYGPCSAVHVHAYTLMHLSLTLTNTDDRRKER